MVITFNELRRIKDKLPSGSSQRIADELNIDVNVVRNYFGGTHFKEGGPVGIHLEKGPDGGSGDFRRCFDPGVRDAYYRRAEGSAVTWRKSGGREIENGLPAVLRAGRNVFPCMSGGSVSR